MNPDKRSTFPMVSAGFTLMELLVVSAIIGLVLAVVPPMLNKVVPGAQVKAAARYLAAGLKSARTDAISSGEEVVLSLDVEDFSYALGVHKRKLNLPEAATLTLTTAETEQISAQRGGIRFYSDGSSTGGQIRLDYEQTRFLVDVNWLTGKVTISP